MPDSGWTRLYSGSAAEPFSRAIDDVINDVGTSSADGLDSGKALLHAYLAVARSSAVHRSEAVRSIDDLVDTLAAGTYRASLYGGVAGVAWLSQHIGRLFGDAEDDIYAQTDAALLSHCRMAIYQPFTYDLISGEAGIGVYFLERLPSPGADQALRVIVATLKSLAEGGDGRLTWHTAAEVLPPSYRDAYPQGYYNLGVAHGVPGIIGLLAEILRCDSDIPETAPLITAAVQWVLDNKARDNSFAPCVAMRRQLEPSPADDEARLSWCYGPLGIAVVLLNAALALRDGALERSILEIATSCANRRLHPRTVDAGLCHGAAGNAHLFNRLYQATGWSCFREAALDWFDRALAMRNPGSGVGGFRMWAPGQGPAGTDWSDDASFLSGATGVALAFLAATSDIEPAWDRLLLARLPCR